MNRCNSFANLPNRYHDRYSPYKLFGGDQAEVKWRPNIVESRWGFSTCLFFTRGRIATKPIQSDAGRQTPNPFVKDDVIKDDIVKDAIVKDAFVKE